MAPWKPSARALRRARERAHQKLARDLDRLAHLEPGGSLEHPIEIVSPAQVEVMALARPCPLCGGSLRLEEHAAVTVGGARRRVARMACALCGIRRAIYFSLTEPPVQ
jgi:hypothetical protein